MYDYSEDTQVCWCFHVRIFSIGICSLIGEMQKTGGTDECYRDAKSAADVESDLAGAVSIPGAKPKSKQIDKNIFIFKKK